MSSSFVIGKNLATTTAENSSSDSFPISSGNVSPSSSKTVKRCSQDLRIIRHFAKTHKVTLKDAVESIAISIQKVAKDNDQYTTRPSAGSILTEFDAIRPPKVDLIWYLWRVVNDLNAAKEPVLFRNDGSSVDLTKEGEGQQQIENIRYDDSAMGRGLRCLLFALVYVDRMTQKSNGNTNHIFRVNSNNVHRIMLGTLYEAHKFSDDAPFKLSHFALLGGVSTEELRRIEVAVCLGLEFNFYISEAEFHAHSLSQLNFAVKGAYQRKLKLRRHNELMVMMNNNDNNNNNTTEEEEEQRNNLATINEKRTLNLDDTYEYGLGGSTPLITSQKRRI